MSKTLTLTSPFLDLELEGLSKWEMIGLAALWFVTWTALGVGIIYAYAVLFANWVGFETALLVGIALIALGTTQPQ